LCSRDLRFFLPSSIAATNTITITVVILRPPRRAHSARRIFPRRPKNLSSFLPKHQRRQRRVGQVWKRRKARGCPMFRFLKRGAFRPLLFPRADQAMQLVPSSGVPRLPSSAYPQTPSFPQGLFTSAVKYYMRVFCVGFCGARRSPVRDLSKPVAPQFPVCNHSRYSIANNSFGITSLHKRRREL
jgi:hypothetical protein